MEETTWEQSVSLCSFGYTIVHSPVFSSWKPFDPYPIGVLCPYFGHWWPALPSVSLGSKAPCGKVEKFQPFHCRVGAPQTRLPLEGIQEPPPTHHLIGIQRDIAFKRLKKFWEPYSKKQKKQQDTFFLLWLHTFFNAFLVNSLCVNESFWTPDNIKGGCGSIPSELQNLSLVELAVGLQES